MEKEIIIIGAGIAGLSLAYELKKQNKSFVVLEAQNTPGGRAATIKTLTGIDVDLGGHWLHGEHNPLRKVMERYRIDYDKDDAGEMIIYKDGKHKADDGWLEKAIDSDKAKKVKSRELPDIPLPELACDEESKEMLTSFALMWDGLTPPEWPSAREFLSDQGTPGGVQIEGGMASLVNALIKDIGEENIIFNSPVEKITSNTSGAQAVLKNGRLYNGKKAVFTGSLGVIKSGIVKFDPPLSRQFMVDMEMVAMGKMNKIILELEPEFFPQHNVPTDLALELLDDNPPHFCHVYSRGEPFITLFIAGPQAEEVEKLTPEQARNYITRVLTPVEELKGFEKYIVGEAIVTGWVGNPYTKGSYSACLPGGKRTGPREEGNIIFCGDTFDTEYPASMAGAYQSALKTAEILSRL